MICKVILFSIFITTSYAGLAQKNQLQKQASILISNAIIK